MTSPTLSELEALCDEAICLDGHRLAGIAAGGRSPHLVPGRPFDLPEDLLGTPIPAEWLGVALVAGGRAVNPDDPLPRPTRPVRLAHLLVRDGRVATCLWTPEAVHRHRGEQAVNGHLADVARRLLDLPTAEEVTPTMWLVHVSWVEELVAAAAHTPLTWEEAARRHPAYCDDDHPDALGAGAARLSATTSWHRLWQRHVSDGLPLGRIDPWQVAQLDAGSFARFALALVPDLVELCHLLDGLVTARVRRGVRATLAAAERHRRATSAPPAVRHRDNRCR